MSSRSLPRFDHARAEALVRSRVVPSAFDVATRVADDAPACDDDDAMAERAELVEIRAEDEHARALLRGRDDLEVDLPRRRDVDAARRLREDEHASRLRASPVHDAPARIRRRA